MYQIQILHKIPKSVKIFLYILDASISLVCLWNAKNYAMVLSIIFFGGIISTIILLYTEKKELNKISSVYKTKLSIKNIKRFHVYLNVYFNSFVAKYYFMLMTVVGIEMSGIGYLYDVVNPFIEYILVLALILLVFVSIGLSVFIILANGYDIIDRSKKFYRRLKLIEIEK